MICQQTWLLNKDLKKVREQAIISWLKSKKSSMTRAEWVKRRIVNDAREVTRKGDANHIEPCKQFLKLWILFWVRWEITGIFWMEEWYDLICILADYFDCSVRNRQKWKKENQWEGFYNEPGKSWVFGCTREYLLEQCSWIGIDVLVLRNVIRK